MPETIVFVRRSFGLWSGVVLKRYMGKDGAEMARVQYTKKNGKVREARVKKLPTGRWWMVH